MGSEKGKLALLYSLYMRERKDRVVKGTEIVLLGSTESLERLPYCIEIVFGQKLQLVKQYSLWKIKNKNSRGDLLEGWSGGFLVSQLT